MNKNATNQDHTVDNLYDREFYLELEGSASTSAREIVPYVLSLYSIDSVVDIGCGTGDWLSVFKENGVSRIVGLDGNYVDPEVLKIGKEDFRPSDLSQPFFLDERFDLAMSLEVVEHLPESSACQFVENITKLASVILFSASIPHQEGTGHINEQWMNYWIDLFKTQGFIPIDGVRWRFWDNQNVAWWYKQNAVFFVEEARLSDFPRLDSLRDQYRTMPSAIVHPDIYLHHVSKARVLEDELSRKIDNPIAVMKRVLKRLLRTLPRAR